ncbi:hypothetical protein TRFO_34700 [Tritrichomonas foetus]|uniref:NADPH--hemoprotein reductase n=1 Tax=Tritrichomonas foetus TaxID=1144522 RepID=A0A1J4JK03_9EUKA|nr:hypothetical protein TRFO_34700 [Tritrichomonas foetus]|eukprot:OHS98937.1 hypothetical protein TRFO_34700 [Tritrichomonas foetus]
MGTISVPINSLSIKSLMKHKMVIFILSTIGEGEFPANARKFVASLQDSMEPLDDVKFAVLGLGSKDFKHFCVAGIQLSEMMEQHLAHQIIPFQPIDTHTADHGESEFEQWAHKLCSALRLKSPTIGIQRLFSLTKINDDSVSSSMIRPNGFIIASLISTTKLTSDNCLRDMRLYKIKLPKGVHFSVGEYLSILPQNPPQIVDKVIDILKFDPNEAYRVMLNDTSVETYVTERVSVRQLFLQYLDLCCPPSRSLMRAFLEVANDEGKEIITELLDVSKSEKLNKYIEDTNSAEFIEEFSKYGIPSIDLIMSSIKHVKPRLYTIASSPDHNNSYLEIVVTQQRFGKDFKREGLCSTYLMNPNLKKIAVTLEPGAVTPPEDRKAPVIIVCLGRGLSAALGLIRNRNEGDGDALVLFGGKNENDYIKVVEMLREYKNNGIITDLLFAWSDEKKHIQDVMKENKSLLGKYWLDEMASFYYSGHPGSIPNQLKEIMLDVCIKEHGLSMEEAMAVNNRHPFIIEAY